MTIKAWSLVVFPTGRDEPRSRELAVEVKIEALAGFIHERPHSAALPVTAGPIESEAVCRQMSGTTCVSFVQTVVAFECLLDTRIEGVQLRRCGFGLRLSGKRKK